MSRIKVLRNKVEYIAEYRGETLNVFFVEREILCNSAVTD